MISGTTRLAAVIGDPVRHSLSPAIHNAGFRELGLDWVYLALPVAAGQGAAAVEAMRTFGIDGLSVTMPHKADVAAAADDLTPAARSLGVANCLFRRGDRIVGDSTDGDGFVAAYQAEFDADLADTTVLVLGAGGAARAVVEAVGRAGAARIVVANRSLDKAASAAELASQAVVGELNDADLVSTADVIVNASAVGMAGGPDPDGIPVPVASIGPDHRVIDIVYQPRTTPLMAAAAERGAATGNGLGMLVHQAAGQFRHWTGHEPPLAAMTAAAAASA